jgi:hypothetical protein
MDGQGCEPATRRIRRRTMVGELAVEALNGHRFCQMKHRMGSAGGRVRLHGDPTKRTDFFAGHRLKAKNPPEVVVLVKGNTRQYNIPACVVDRLV